MVEAKTVKIYRNMDVEKLVAAVPRNHRHVRFAIFLRDQVIVLQEATIAAIVRAYAYTAIHPRRRGIVLVNERLSQDRKPGFAEYQLIEIEDSEEEAVKVIEDLLGGGE